MACEHEMSIMSVGEHYYWEDDIYNLEVREVWECEKCGEVVNCPANPAVQNHVIDSMYV